MNNTKLQWATPNIDKEIMYMAATSNTDNEEPAPIVLAPNDVIS